MKSTLAIHGGPKVRTKPFVTTPEIGKEERDQVLGVLDKGTLSGFIAMPGDAFLGGTKVKELEKLFTDYFKTHYAVAMNSATSALHAAVAALGIGPGDEVIVPPYTMSATAAAVLMQCAVPVFADIEADSFCIDVKSIESKITPRTKAIMVVHLFGQAADMDAILATAKKHNLRVIEDCAQAPGAAYKGKKVGTIGDIGIFSLNQHKIITTGEGGVAITNNKDYAFAMQLVRNHGEVVLGEMGLPLENCPNVIGWNYRITELDAAVGIPQFQRLETLTKQRIELCDFVSEKLKAFDGLTPPKTWNDRRHVYFTYPVKFDSKKIGISRTQFVDALRAEGIPCAGGYVRPIYHQPIYQKRTAFGDKGWPFTSIEGKGPSYAKGECPVTERMYAEELVVFPFCKAPQTIEDMKDFIAAVEKIFQNREALKQPAAAAAGK